MSGIAGIIHFDDAPVEPGLIEKMTSALAHRGPDGIAHWVKGSIALGQCMLRTTPESLEETQPLANEDESLILVMDGRVDNWEELRRELLGKGAALRTRADAELVLRAYEVWGRDCLAHIDGDFALVIWDARRREAFCARDRMGHKPFNYHWNGRTLAFASELRAILDLPWVPQAPNEGVLAEYLAAEWHSRDETLWTGILRLVAAHRMTVGSAGPRPEIYWEPDLSQKPGYTKDQDYIDHYRELFTDSVRRLSRSHRPVAIEVSGGLDSSAIFCMAEHLRRNGRLPAPALEGYTLAFHDDSAANDLPYARAVGEYLGIKIHEIPPTIAPLDWYEHRARTRREFPGFPNGIMSTGLTHAARGAGSRVILDGVGGNEWQDGSHAYYADDLSRHRWRSLWQSFCTDAGSMGVVQSLMLFVRYGLAADLPSPIVSMLRKLRGTSNHPFWLSPQMQRRIKRRSSIQSPRPRAAITSQRLLLQVLAEDAYRELATEETDRLSAAAGVEPRSPLNTAAIAQYAIATPERLRMRGGQTKFMHRRAMQDLMPRVVVDRGDNAEFSSVFAAHLQRMKHFFGVEIPASRPTWVVRDGVVRLYSAYQSGRLGGRPAWALWALYGCDALIARSPVTTFHEQQAEPAS